MIRSEAERLYAEARAALISAGYERFFNGGFLAAKGYQGPGLFLSLDAPPAAEQVLAPFVALGLNTSRADVWLPQE